MFKVVIPQELEAISLPLQNALNAGSAVGLPRPDIDIGVSLNTDITIQSGTKCWNISYQKKEHCYQINISGNEMYQIEICYRGKSGTIAETWQSRSEYYSFVSDQDFDFSSRQSQLGYLGWLVATISFEFSLPDALTLAHLGRDVSRETWLNSHKEILRLAAADSTQTISDFMPVDLVAFKLYPVVDNIVQLDQLLALGVKTVQLRIKNIDDKTERAIKHAIESGVHYQAQVFINDHWQLAIKHGAYGIHLGQEDIREADLLAISRCGIRLGVSSHGYHEMRLAACINPSYIAIGHIFPTTTKQMESSPQGLVRLKLYQQFINSYADNRPLPSCAIGGINLQNASQVAACGVNSIAVVRAITEAECMASAVSHLTEALENTADE